MTNWRLICQQCPSICKIPLLIYNSPRRTAKNNLYKTVLGVGYKFEIKNPRGMTFYSCQSPALFISPMLFPSLDCGLYYCFPLSVPTGTPSLSDFVLPYSFVILLHFIHPHFGTIYNSNTTVRHK